MRAVDFHGKKRMDKLAIKSCLGTRERESLAVNLGQNATLVSASCILLPFVRTGMTDEYADNPRVFSRWQPRMLETNEAALAFMRLLSRPQSELNQGIFELMIGGTADKVTMIWKKVGLDIREEELDGN